MEVLQSHVQKRGNKSRTANKQIGNRAGEVLLLGICAKFNGSNSIEL